MTINLTPVITEKILGLLKEHPKFKNLLVNIDPLSLDTDPWKSNFSSVTYSEDPIFCGNIGTLLNEGKTPHLVAIMRSVDDPDEIIEQFHGIHVDSRKSDKSLLALAGSSDYSIFAMIDWKQVNLFEKLYIWGLHVLLYLIERLRLRPLQGRLSHNLPNSIRRKVYDGVVYKAAATGELIKFNNMLPHHSHPLPTQFSLLLQVVYDSPKPNVR